MLISQPQQTSTTPKNYFSLFLTLIFTGIRIVIIAGNAMATVLPLNPEIRFFPITFIVALIICISSFSTRISRLPTLSPIMIKPALVAPINTSPICRLTVFKTFQPSLCKPLRLALHFIAMLSGWHIESLFGSLSFFVIRRQKNLPTIYAKICIPGVFFI